ncbi:hypothetical protein LCGC14_1185810 [marine sediment metagenome]|uniref:Uncharacterized protein n=1 Tax=marine sediment metagenome TaxID=412755 RepID=A0A0F9LQP0_9ZZZZ
MPDICVDPDLRMHVGCEVCDVENCEVREKPAEADNGQE